MKKITGIAILLGILALAVLIPFWIGGTQAAVASILIIAMLGIIGFIMNPLFFVVIPKNHAVCVTIEGNLSHYMMSKKDKEKVLTALNVAIAKLPAGHTLLTNPFDKDSIVCREEHPFWGMFVSLFNAHFKSWNFLSSKLKKISVKRTMKNPEFRKEGKVTSYVIPSDKDEETTETQFLRLEFPRVGTVMNVELGDNTGINLAYSVSLLVVFDLEMAFFIRSAEFSVMIDEAIETAFLAYLKNINFEDYTRLNFGTNPNTPLNIFMREDNTSNDPEHSSGLSHIGILITGTVSVPAREAATGSEEMVKATTRKSVGNANAEALKIETEAKAKALEIETAAKAAAIIETGRADAVRIAEAGRAEAATQTLLNQAETARAEKLAASLGQKGAAEVLQAEKLGGVGTVIIGGNTPVTVPVGAGDNGNGNRGRDNANRARGGQNPHGGPPPPPPAPRPNPNPPPNPPAPPLEPPTPPAS